MSDTPPRPGPQRRKVRMVRPDGPADDLLVVVRATPADRELAVAKIAEDAEESARVYVVAEGDTTVILHGVSVFAHRQGVEIADVLRRFPFAPFYAATTVGRLRAAGFPVLPTGGNLDHSDAQLVPSRTVEEGSAGADNLAEAAARMLDAAGELQPNPAYAGALEEP